MQCDFFVFYIVTSVIQMIEYILHGFCGCSLGFKATFFDLLALATYIA